MPTEIILQQTPDAAALIDKREQLAAVRTALTPDELTAPPTLATTVAKPLDSARRTWTTLEYRSSPRPVTDGPGRGAHSSGSEGPTMTAKRQPRYAFLDCARGEAGDGNAGRPDGEKHGKPWPPPGV